MELSIRPVPRASSDGSAMQVSLEHSWARPRPQKAAAGTVLEPTGGDRAGVPIRHGRSTCSVSLMQRKNDVRGPVTVPFKEGKRCAMVRRHA